MNQDWSAIVPRLLHDARALLRAPSTKAQLLQRRLEDADASQLALLESVIDGHKRLELFLNRVTNLQDAMNAGQTTSLPLTTVVLAARVAAKPVLENVGGQVEFSGLPDCSVSATLEKVLIELLSNSVNFRSTERTPHARIEGQLQRDSLHLIYSDNSSGWDPRYTAKIFQPFERLDASRSQFGLGLTIAKVLVENNGGSIHAKTSQTGVCFELQLPYVLTS